MYIEYYNFVVEIINSKGLIVLKKTVINAYKPKSELKNDKLIMAVLLGVCISAALITFVTVSMIKRFKSKDVSESNTVQVEDFDESIEEVSVTKEPKEDAVSSENVVIEQKAESPKIPEVTEEKPVEENYIWPCSGSVIKEFSVSMPLYSKTLDDWRIHPGIDISCPEGEKVCAVAGGLVVNAYNDLKMGFTVCIDHGNNVTSVYSNLCENVNVYAGQNIKKGDVISTVGNTALFESGDDSHLHFEMQNNGKCVNPLDYLSLR